MMIISILEPLPTHIVTSPSTSLCLFCNSCFELLIFSNRTSIKYPGATINTSKAHINNLYIIYTLVHFAILLIHQLFRAFPLPVTISFAVEALSFRLVSSFGNFKKNGKQVATLMKKPKARPKPETKCFYFKGTGHWKRNCPKYLVDKKDGKVKGIFYIHVIDVYLTNAHSSAWVFDTGSVAHICNSKQGLQIKRRLAKDEVTMRVGNGSKVDVIAVGTLPLHLSSGLVLDLNNCYLVPLLSMNIISGSCLMRDSYSFKS